MCWCVIVVMMCCCSSVGERVACGPLRSRDCGRLHFIVDHLPELINLEGFNALSKECYLAAAGPHRAPGEQNCAEDRERAPAERSQKSKSPLYTISQFAFENCSNQM